MHKATKKFSAFAAAALLAASGTVAAATPASAAPLDCDGFTFADGGNSKSKSIDHKCTGSGKVTYTRKCAYGIINKSVSASYKFSGGTETARITLDCGIAGNTGNITYTVS